MSDRPISHATLVRAILVSLGAVQSLNGLYALFWPQSFYDDFPAGRSWVAAYPSYSEHLVRDVGGLFLGTGVLMLIAAAWLTRKLVIAAVVAWLLFAIPHTSYHLLDPEGPDRAANVASLLATVGLPILVLALMGRPGRPAPTRDRASAGAGARVTMVDKPKGVVPRLFFRESRRRLGTVVDPARAYAHTPLLMAGYGVMELTAERSPHCDLRLKELAVIRTAMLVGCAWCLDFGSAELLARGIPEDDLKDLARYSSSPRFSALDRLVLDYATAMTRTPLDVPEELVAQLRGLVGDPALVELTHMIALENLRARFNWALGIESQGFSTGSYCVLPERSVPVTNP